MNNQIGNHMSYTYEKWERGRERRTDRQRERESAYVIHQVKLWNYGNIFPHYGKEDSAYCTKSVHAARPTAVTEQGRRRALVIIGSSINPRVSVTISNDNIQWCSCWLDQCQQCCWKMLMGKKRVDSSRGLEFEGGRKQHWGWSKCNPLHFNVCTTTQDLWIWT